MRLVTKGLVVLATASTVIACGATVESTWQNNGIKTAAFDLQCPPEKIDMTVLNRNDGMGCLGSRVGVRGCGKQTQYECDNAREWHRSAEVSAVDSK